MADIETTLREWVSEAARGTERGAEFSIGVLSAGRVGVTLCEAAGQSRAYGWGSGDDSSEAFSDALRDLVDNLDSREQEASDDA